LLPDGGERSVSTCNLCTLTVIAPPPTHTHTHAHAHTHTRTRTHTHTHTAVRRAGHVARMGERRILNRGLVGNLRERVMKLWVP